MFRGTANQIEQKIGDNKKKIILTQNKRYHIEVNPEKGVRWLIFGDAGKGKSWLLATIFMQLNNGIVFDPSNGGLLNTIKKMCKLYRLNYWRVMKDFDVLVLEKGNNRNRFRINVCDIAPECVDLIFPYSTGGSSNKNKQRNALTDFFSKKQEKTYAGLKELCVKHHIEHVLHDLDYILDKKDKAPSLESYCYGKKIVDIQSLSVRSFSLGVFIKSLMVLRSKWTNKKRLNINNMLYLLFDEAQRYAKLKTAVGESLASINREARKFGIGSILCGSSYRKLEPDIRASWNMVFAYYCKVITSKLRSEAIDINEDEWDYLPENHCYVLDSEANKFKGAVGKDFFMADDFFWVIKKRRATSKEIVSNSKPVFPVRRLLVQKTH